MALTKCRECGEKVSTDARACPSCGAVGPTAEALGWHFARMAGWFIVCLSILTIGWNGC